MSLRDAAQTSSAPVVSAGLPGCERDVSVCFIDLRNYTRHTEENAPAEVYRFLSEYFRTVGDVVERHGGTLVEFQGDGVVVAFGATQDRADKEDAAIHAACEIRQVMRALGIPIRIGIATGTAFVGQMSALDRRAFCVIGAPTVMASRLQELADQLGTAIVVDDRTLQAVQPLEGVRRHRRLPIHGSARRHDVFALHDGGDAAASPAPAARPPRVGERLALTCPLGLELARASV